MMNWMITNMTTSDRAAEAIRSLDVLGGSREPVDVDGLHNMVDFTDEQWTMVLTELDFVDFVQLAGTTIQLTRTPEYDSIDR